MELMNFTEYVIIEEKKTELFRNKLNYLCMANNFKAAMERDYHCKQILRFLKKHWGYDDNSAKHTADKLNQARRK